MSSSSDFPRQKTGRRKAVDIESPRDKTVCFMLSEEEKATVDMLGVCARLTRSALLAKITVLFLENTNIDQPKENQKEAEEKLLEFMEEVRVAQTQTSAWMKDISNKTKT